MLHKWGKFKHKISSPQNVRDENIFVEIWTRRGCSACVQAKQFFFSHKIKFEEHKLTSDARTQAYFQQITNGARTVPQIFIRGQRIGGFDDAMILHKKGKLIDMINGRLPKKSIFSSLFKRGHDS